MPVRSAFRLFELNWLMLCPWLDVSNEVQVVLVDMNGESFKLPVYVRRVVELCFLEADPDPESSMVLSVDFTPL